MQNLKIRYIIVTYFIFYNLQAQFYVVFFHFHVAVEAAAAAAVFVIAAALFL
jgi:hypothetical protein